MVSFSDFEFMIGKGRFYMDENGVIMGVGYFGEMIMGCA